MHNLYRKLSVDFFVSDVIHNIADGFQLLKVFRRDLNIVSFFKCHNQFKQKNWLEMPVEEHVALYESQGFDRKEAMKKAAKDRGVSKRDIYQSLL